MKSERKAERSLLIPMILSLSSLLSSTASIFRQFLRSPLSDTLYPLQVAQLVESEYVYSEEMNFPQCSTFSEDVSFDDFLKVLDSDMKEN
jgi:hypothetical protein